jgi:hypothetical protein
MRILSTVNLDGDFRAGDGAQRAARAIFTSAKNDGAVALGIVIAGGLNMPVFTSVDAEVAFLAAFEVDCDPAFFQWSVIPSKNSGGLSNPPGPSCVIHAECQA